MHLQVQGEVQGIWITGKLKRTKRPIINTTSKLGARTGSYLICLVDERGYCSALFAYPPDKQLRCYASRDIAPLRGTWAIIGPIR